MPTKSPKSATVNIDKNNLAMISIMFAVNPDTTTVTVSSSVSLDDQDEQVIKFISHLIHQTIVSKVLTKPPK